MERGQMDRPAEMGTEPGIEESSDDCGSRVVGGKGNFGRINRSEHE
jgi:hypothetical protein